MAVKITYPKHGFRREMSLWERLYLPAIFRGLRVTMKHFFMRGWTVQYPDEMPEVSSRFRGLHRLKRDEEERERCTACFLCAYVCPADAIHIEASLATGEERNLYAEEKYAAVYQINMLRCIYCGLCEEACPEEAIFMSKTYVVTGLSRELMIFDKAKLYEIGGERHDEIRKWSPERKGTPTRSHVEGDEIAPSTAGGH